MRKVLIPTKLDRVSRDLLVAQGYQVVQDADTPLAELVKKNADVDAIIVRSEKVTAAVIDALPKLKLAVRAGSGYDNLDTKYARRKGIDVMNTPGANSNGVAEEVIALLLAHFRFVVPADANTRGGGWEKKKFMGREVAGKTIGIVGLGNIGQLVVKRLAGFDAKFLGFDPVISAQRAEEIGAKLVPLETLFAESDVVTLHVPETPETLGMVNRKLLSIMRPGATIINCARAGIINEDDLRALKKEKNLGFCTDVYPEDVAGPKTCADIADVMMPHLGASTHEANWTAAKRAAEQLIAYFERGVTRYVVNKGIPDGLDERYQQLAYHVACVARRYLGSDQPVRHVSCSFYGGLDEYAKWLLPPVVAAISGDFDAWEDPETAQEFLSGKGITCEVRATDESKKYGRSVTLDLQAGQESVRQVSVRGTIAEGNLMISRINRYDRLYFQPQGHSLIVEYRDRPGVLAKITGACAAYNINIDDIRAPRDESGAWSLAVLKTNQPVPPEAVERIRREIEPEVVFTVSIP